MKELTIEEKAKAFDEALSKAKQVYKTPYTAHWDVMKELIEHLFPELTESDDERIRKELLSFCQNRAYNYSNDPKYANIGNWIAWLEKQGVQKPTNNKEDERMKQAILGYLEGSGSEHEIIHGIKIKDAITWLEKQGEPMEINPTEFDTRLQALIGKFDSLPKEELIGSLSFWMNVVQNDGTYKPEEKQGEQETLCDKCKKEHPSHSCQDITALGRCVVEHEQKSSDKVEPKFHKGDWVVNRHDSVYQVEKIENYEYTLRHILGGSMPLSFSHEDMIRAWTIQDAKDCDILVYKDEISLYKHDIKNCTKESTNFGGFVYHCCYDGKRFITDSLYSLTEQDKTDIHPATKEQRDILMKVMAGAGYTFDFEKKELKKVEPKFHVGDWVMVSTAVGDRVVQIASVGYLKDGHPSYITTEGRWFDNRTKARLLADMEISTLPESRVIVTQKPSEWSEEDNIQLQAAINICKSSGHTITSDWLKSLRPQPKQEWSKEDEKNINFLCELLTDLQVKSTENEIKHGTNSHSEYYYNIKKWLKSLKERIGV